MLGKVAKLRYSVTIDRSGDSYHLTKTEAQQRYQAAPSIFPWLFSFGFFSSWKLQGIIILPANFLPNDVFTQSKDEMVDADARPGLKNLNRIRHTLAQLPRVMIQNSPVLVQYKKIYFAKLGI